MTAPLTAAGKPAAGPACRARRLHMLTLRTVCTVKSCAAALRCGCGATSAGHARPARPLLHPTLASAARPCSVLDVGCGIGDNALYIARHARKATVTACDLVRAWGRGRRRVGPSGHSGSVRAVVCALARCRGNMCCRHRRCHHLCRQPPLLLQSATHLSCHTARLPSQVERALDVARQKAAGTGLPLEVLQQDLLGPLQGELQASA